MWQVFLAFFIDGDAEGMRACALGFDHRLARVFDAVGLSLGARQAIQFCN